MICRICCWTMAHLPPVPAEGSGSCQTGAGSWRILVVPQTFWCAFDVWSSWLFFYRCKQWLRSRDGAEQNINTHECSWSGMEKADRVRDASGRRSSSVLCRRQENKDCSSASTNCFTFPIEMNYLLQLLHSTIYNQVVEKQNSRCMYCILTNNKIFTFLDSPWHLL